IISEHIFDTQIAEGLVLLGDQLSYARVVDGLMGVTHSTDDSNSDELERRLSPAETAYAVEDLRYLLLLADTLAVSVKSQVRTLDDLQRLRGFPTRELERSGNALLGLVAEGLAVPENARPQPLHGRGPTPAEELIVKVLEACLKALCAREKLSSAFIASRTDL